VNAAQLVQDHWEFMQRITNDDEEAQQLALRVLEKFEQFKPERSTFGQFIQLKLRELRQHYSDKGVVYHPCRKESGGYVSFDEVQTSNDRDDEEVEVGLYNLIAASLPPPWVQLDRRAGGRSWHRQTAKNSGKVLHICGPTLPAMGWRNASRGAVGNHRQFGSGCLFLGSLRDCSSGPHLGKTPTSCGPRFGCFTSMFRSTFAFRPSFAMPLRLRLRPSLKLCRAMPARLCLRG
jgi:hypothetical protein